MINLATLSKLTIPEETVLLIHKDRAAVFSEADGIAVFDVNTGEEITPIEDEGGVEYPTDNTLLEAAERAWNYIFDTENDIPIDY